MKIIHCSDLHLDSAMESNFSIEQAQDRNYEVFLTFKKLISYAQREMIEAIIIAGDMFDENRVSSKTLEMVSSLIEEAADIQFVYLQGNHDSLRDCGLKELPNLKTFGNKWEYHHIGQVTIAGIELDRENCHSLYDELTLSAEGTNIVVLHGQEAAHVGEELVCINKLRDKNIDYLALGHIHSYKLESLDMRGKYAYSGCLEGRGFDECGDKGFVLLNIDGKQVDVQFVPFARRKLHEVALDITGLIGISEILSKAEMSTKDISGDDLVKIVLTGTYLPETNKDLQFLQKSLSDKFYYLKIKDKSKLYIDAGDYKYDKTLKGEFVRMVLASDKDEEEKDRIICAGLAALKGEKISL